MAYEIASMLGAQGEQRWDSFVAAHPDAHLLQSANWGRLKSAFGWFSRIAAIADTERNEIVAGGQILFRRLPFGLGTLAYLPAGPLFYGDDPAHPANRMLWQTIDAAARRERAIFLKGEPGDWYRPRSDLPGQFANVNFPASPPTLHA